MGDFGPIFGPNYYENGVKKDDYRCSSKSILFRIAGHLFLLSSNICKYNAKLFGLTKIVEA
jgi:hypothetical protein